MQARGSLRAGGRAPRVTATMSSTGASARRCAPEHLCSLPPADRDTARVPNIRLLDGQAQRFADEVLFRHDTSTGQPEPRAHRSAGHFSDCQLFFPKSWPGSMSTRAGSTTHGHRTSRQRGCPGNHVGYHVVVLHAMRPRRAAAPGMGADQPRRISPRFRRSAGRAAPRVFEQIGSRTAQRLAARPRAANVSQLMNQVRVTIATTGRMNEHRADRISCGHVLRPPPVCRLTPRRQDDVRASEKTSSTRRAPSESERRASVIEGSRGVRLTIAITSRSSANVLSRSFSTGSLPRQVITTLVAGNTERAAVPPSGHRPDRHPDAASNCRSVRRAGSAAGGSPLDGRSGACATPSARRP